MLLNLALADFFFQLQRACFMALTWFWLKAIFDPNRLNDSVSDQS